MITFENEEKLKEYVKGNIVDSVEVARLLGCSRQYVDKLMRSGKLTPLYASQRNRLYYRPDIVARIKERT